MNINFVVFCLTLVAIIAIVFGKDNLAETAVFALAHRFEDAIKTVGQAVRLLAPQTNSMNADEVKTGEQNDDD